MELTKDDATPPPILIFCPSIVPVFLIIPAAFSSRAIFSKPSPLKSRVAEVPDAN